ncbi:SAP18 domain-containing protein [Rhizoctonia solani AG-1 IA]|uniref:SAP18 domain-containing protein n=1 Tax=Thanatephorus cucumeris (strain AG1-IA) TaxID=983506 RepID=L8X9F4_THACA|nr:SAP18 domain-containing protein [Rhizoctonia solani AG-1 IA]
MTTEVEKIQVDRTKKCPFLLRTFVRSGGFHPETAFDNGRVPTLDEHAVHAWGDSTLIDIVRALRAQTPSPSLPAGAFRNPGTRYSFRVVYYDRGNVASRELGHIGPRELNDTSVLYPSSGGQTPTPPTEPVDLPAESAMDADDDSPRKDRDDDDVLPPGTNSGSGGRAKSAPNPPSDPLALLFGELTVKGKGSLADIGEVEVEAAADVVDLPGW